MAIVETSERIRVEVSLQGAVADTTWSVIRPLAVVAGHGDHLVASGFRQTVIFRHLADSWCGGRVQGSIVLAVGPT